MTPTADERTLAEHPLVAGRHRGSSQREAGDGRARRANVGSTLHNLDWRQAVGGALIAIGMVAITVAWWQISGTPHPGEQMPSFASGGLGGAALIVVGVLLLNSYEHAQDREALFEVLERIDDLEQLAQERDDRLTAELERVALRIEDRLAANGSAGRSRRPTATRGAST